MKVKATHFLSSLVILLCSAACTNQYPIAIQNCQGKEATVTLVIPDSFVLHPEAAKQVKEGQMKIRLKYTESVVVGQVSRDEVQSGLPFEKMTVVRSEGTTVILKQDTILHLMKNDIFGEPAVPFVLCI